MIARYMREVLTVETALEALETAHMLSAEAMKSVVMEFILQHFREVVEREELSTLPSSVLAELLRWKAATDPN